MTLVADIDGLTQRAAEGDIQSLSGVYLQGFDPAADHPLNWGLDEVTPRDVGNIANSLSARYLENAYDHLNDRSGFAPVGVKPEVLAGTRPLVDDAEDAWEELTNLYLADFDIRRSDETGDRSITDNRKARLYVTLDMNEWIEFRRRDVVHLVLNNWDGYLPLGQSTIWLKSDAWVHHNRGKTARVYLQGRIAQRMQQQLIEGETISPQEFVNKILDADTESAYSSVWGPC